MLIPHFWEKVEHTILRNGKEITIARWGWSNESADHAKLVAKQRCELAALSKPLKRKESDAEYGDEERPIKEDILYESMDPAAMIITRNRYGAHCLNTDTLAILDIDLQEHKLPTKYRHILFVFALLAVLVIQASLHISWIWSVMAMAAIYHLVLLPSANIAWRRCTPSPEQEKCDYITAWASDHTVEQRGVRIYKTPAGLRVLLTHRPYEMNDELWSLMKAFGCDPLYITLCKIQKCCRARLTAKPWRMIHHSDLKRPQKCAPLDAAWCERYDRAQDVYSSCHFIQAHGSTNIHPLLTYAIEYHDIQTQALKQKTLA